MSIDGNSQIQLRGWHGVKNHQTVKFGTTKGEIPDYFLSRLFHFEFCEILDEKKSIPSISEEFTINSPNY